MNTRRISELQNSIFQAEERIKQMKAQLPIISTPSTYIPPLSRSKNLISETIQPPSLNPSPLDLKPKLNPTPNSFPHKPTYSSLNSTANVHNFTSSYSSISSSQVRDFPPLRSSSKPPPSSSLIPTVSLDLSSSTPLQVHEPAPLRTSSLPTPATIPAHPLSSPISSDDSYESSLFESPPLNFGKSPSVEYEGKGNGGNGNCKSQSINDKDVKSVQSNNFGNSFINNFSSPVQVNENSVIPISPETLPQVKTLRQALSTALSQVASLTRENTVLHERIAQLETENQSFSTLLSGKRSDVDVLLTQLEHFRENYTPNIQSNSISTLPSLVRSCTLISSQFNQILSQSVKIEDQNSKSIANILTALDSLYSDYSRVVTHLIGLEKSFDQVVIEAQEETSLLSSSLSNLYSTLTSSGKISSSKIVDQQSKLPEQSNLIEEVSFNELIVLICDKYSTENFARLLPLINNLKFQDFIGTSDESFQLISSMNNLLEYLLSNINENDYELFVSFVSEVFGILTPIFEPDFNFNSNSSVIPIASSVLRLCTSLNPLPPIFYSKVLPIIKSISANKPLLLKLIEENFLNGLTNLISINNISQEIIKVIRLFSEICSVAALNSSNFFTKILAFIGQYHSAINLSDFLSHSLALSKILATMSVNGQVRHVFREDSLVSNLIDCIVLYSTIIPEINSEVSNSSTKALDLLKSLLCCLINLAVNGKIKTIIVNNSGIEKLISIITSISTRQLLFDYELIEYICRTLCNVCLVSEYSAKLKNSKELISFLISLIIHDVDNTLASQYACKLLVLVGNSPECSRVIISHPKFKLLILSLKDLNSKSIILTELFLALLEGDSSKFLNSFISYDGFSICSFVISNLILLLNDPSFKQSTSQLSNQSQLIMNLIAKCSKNIRKLSESSNLIEQYLTQVLSNRLVSSVLNLGTIIFDLKNIPGFVLEFLSSILALSSVDELLTLDSEVSSDDTWQFVMVTWQKLIESSNEKLLIVLVVNVLLPFCSSPTTSTYQKLIENQGLLQKSIAVAAQLSSSLFSLISKQ
ncbi:hypothetical protein RCL1_004203 [Eukaryota sp. TZLM3-RCL]